MRPALLYPLLVGLPALGVVAIIRIGERIVPPPAIGGVWTAAAAGPAASSVASIRCGGALELRTIVTARLSQSGTSAFTELQDAAGTTWAQGTVTVRAGGTVAEGVLSLVGCAQTTVRLTMTFDAAATPTGAALVVAPLECSECSPARVRLNGVARDGAPAGAFPASGH